MPDVLDAEGLVFPLTSREIVEAAKNIRWYLETFLLYETYISGILETTEKKTVGDKGLQIDSYFEVKVYYLTEIDSFKERQPKFAEREDFLKKI